jgi:hypothetical protein
MRPPSFERRFPKTFPSDQCLESTLVALRGLALPENGAGDGTHIQTPTPCHCYVFRLTSSDDVLKYVLFRGAWQSLLCVASHSGNIYPLEWVICYS